MACKIEDIKESMIKFLSPNNEDWKAGYDMLVKNGKIDDAALTTYIRTNIKAKKAEKLNAKFDKVLKGYVPKVIAEDKAKDTAKVIEQIKQTEEAPKTDNKVIDTRGIKVGDIVAKADGREYKVTGIDAKGKTQLTYVNGAAEGQPAPDTNIANLTLVTDKKELSITEVDGKVRHEFDKLPAYTKGQQNMVYAGIGSRETPKEVLEVMTKAAIWLEGKGYKLQTGYKRKQANGKLIEEGADKAFSDGTNNKELFGPDMANAKTRSIAEEIHPNLKGMWSAVYNKWVSKVGKEKATEYANGAIALQERNTFQVFGAKLDTAVDFVLFYAEETKDPMRPKGGTGQAVEMARRKGIPTINMANKDWREQLLKETTRVQNKSEVSAETMLETANPETIKLGSVVKYKDNYYVVKKVNEKANNVQLINENGENLPGTPGIDKVQFVKQLPVTEFNGVEYAYDTKNDRLYTENGEKWKLKSDPTIAKIISSIKKTTSVDEKLKDNMQEISADTRLETANAEELIDMAEQKNKC